MNLVDRRFLGATISLTPGTAAIVAIYLQRRRSLL